MLIYFVIYVRFLCYSLSVSNLSKLSYSQLIYNKLICVLNLVNTSVMTNINKNNHELM